VSVAETEGNSDAVTRFGDLAMVDDEFSSSIAQVIKIDRNLPNHTKLLYL
jgi:hypothetical protein